MALMLGENMDQDISRKPFPPSTLGISLSTTTKKIIVRADGRTAEFSVKQLMDALGAR